MSEISETDNVTTQWPERDNTGQKLILSNLTKFRFWTLYIYVGQSYSVLPYRKEKMEKYNKLFKELVAAGLVMPNEAGARWFAQMIIRLKL